MRDDTEDGAPGLDIIFGFSGSISQVDQDELVRISVSSPTRSRIILLTPQIFEELLEELDIDGPCLVGQTLTYTRGFVQVAGSKKYCVAGITLE
jgi:hypothetical protein